MLLWLGVIDAEDILCVFIVESETGSFIGDGTFVIFGNSGTGCSTLGIRL